MAYTTIPAAMIAQNLHDTRALVIVGVVCLFVGATIGVFIAALLVAARDPVHLNPYGELPVDPFEGKS